MLLTLHVKRSFYNLTSTNVFILLHYTHKNVILLRSIVTSKKKFFTIVNSLQESFFQQSSTSIHNIHQSQKPLVFMPINVSIWWQAHWSLLLLRFNFIIMYRTVARKSGLTIFLDKISLHLGKKIHLTISKTLLLSNLSNWIINRRLCTSQFWWMHVFFTTFE